MSTAGRARADETLAAALAAGSTVADACAKAGIGETTAYKRLKDPNFTARVKELRGEMVHRAAGQLADSMTEAATELRNLLTSANESVRLRAADRLIELGVKVTELADLQARVEELERRLAAEGPK